MKKSNLIYSLIYIVFAGLFLYLAIIFDDNKMSGIFYGMTGALGGQRYLYITSILLLD